MPARHLGYDMYGGNGMVMVTVKMVITMVVVPMMMVIMMITGNHECGPLHHWHSSNVSQGPPPEYCLKLKPEE